MWSVLNQAVNKSVDVWLWPFRGLGPLWQVCALALPAAIFSLLVYRFASNQAAIRRTKDRIKAYLLELRLFRDDLGVSLRAEGAILRHSFAYMGHALLPMALMIAPFLLLLAQIESRFAFRGLGEGEPAIVAIKVNPEIRVSEVNPRLYLPRGLSLETPPVRIDATGEILWRIRADRVGSYAVSVEIGDRRYRRQVAVGKDDTHLAPVIYRADDARTALYPAEPALESGWVVQSIEVVYPRARGEFAGLSSASWTLFGLILLFGFLLRGSLGVTF